MADLVDDESKACSICWDEFDTPKNLKCGHTFCLPCLEGYLKKTKIKDEIKCPLCRQTQKAPTGSLNKLPDNYFVKLKPFEPQEELCCCLCFEQANIKSCSHCDLKLCPSCKSSHKLALKLSGNKNEISSNSDSDEDDERDLGEEARLPFHLALSGQLIKTKFNATLKSSFTIRSMSSNPESGQNVFVSTIHATDNGLCEIITGLGPDCVLSDSEGTEMRRRFYDQGVSSILDIGPGQKIIANFHLRTLFKVQEGKDVELFANTKNLQPAAICQIGNGQIVCCGVCRSQRHDLGPYSDDNGEMGALHFYDESGNFLRKNSGSSNESYFKRPMGMSHGKLNDTICVSDTEKNCVYVFDHEGRLLDRYRGGASGGGGMFLFQACAFAPGPICHDDGGNIYVGNRADNTIHVLSPAGHFLGYIASSRDTGFGSPFALCFDSEHRLWVGDSEDGKVRVFEITSFNNSLNINERRSSPTLPGHLLPFL